MRVLHLIDGPSAQACPTTLALLSESLGRLGRIDQRVLLLGGAALSEMARLSGVRDAQTQGVPMGIPLLGWPAVKRRVRQDGPFDLVHCWSLRSLTLASLMLRSVPRLMTLTVAPTAAEVRWMRTLCDAARGGATAPITLLTISSSLRRTLLSGGINEIDAHVLRPGLDMGRVAASSRPALRAAWGAEDERIKVVALLSDPPEAGDAMDALMVVGLADGAMGEALDRLRLRLLVHPAQKNRLRALLVDRNMERLRIISEPALARPWEVLPGCDAALVRGDHGGGLSLLWAMCANVPIVGEATYAISEVVEDRHSALLTKPGELRTQAHRTGQIVGDRLLAWKLRDTARHEAYSFFSRQRYCQNLATVYEQAVQRHAIEVPAMESTGGLRFAGRG